LQALKSKTEPFSCCDLSPTYTTKSGELRAIAYDQAGTVVANASVITASAAQRLLLRISPSTDAALVSDCGDVALVEVAVVDASGTTHPLAAHNITFAVSTNAVLLGTGNGDPTCHVSDKSATRPAFHGLALAIVQAMSGGDITVTAQSDGLQGGSLVIPQVQAPGNSSVPYWCSHWRMPRL
jgi:beta-galactosidase